MRPLLHKPSFNINDVVKDIQHNAWKITRNDQKKNGIHVAFAFYQNLKEQFPVVLESLVSNTQVSLSVYVLCRGLAKSWAEEVANAFHTVNFEFYPCDHVFYGNKLNLLPHTSISTMDRILLPELLSHAEKLVYLDVDLIVLGDLNELYRFDLRDMPLAGSDGGQTWTGKSMIYRAASLLEHSKASELRRRMHDDGPLSFRAFNAGVLLMNLKRMRQDHFCQMNIPLIEKYGLNDQDVLNIYARENRGYLSSEWNTIPSQVVSESAKIIHWSGPQKPWCDKYVAKKEIFEKYRQAYQRRVKNLKNQDNEKSFEVGSSLHAGV